MIIHGIVFRGRQDKNNEYHIVDKVQSSYENTLIDNVVFVAFALYSRVFNDILFISEIGFKILYMQSRYVLIKN
jgi:hypothetical protein